MGGSEGLVRELVRLGAEVNARDRDGIGALIYASSNGHAAVVAVLLDNGAKVNVRNIKNRDALIYASDRGHAAVVAVLLDNGADPTPEIIIAPLWGSLQPVTASPSASSYLAEAPTSWRSMLTTVCSALEMMAMLLRSTARKHTLPSNPRS